LQRDRSQVELQRFPWTRQMLKHMVSVAGWKGLIQMWGFSLFCCKGRWLSLVEEQRRSRLDFGAVLDPFSS